VGLNAHLPWNADIIIAASAYPPWNADTKTTENGTTNQDDPSARESEMKYSAEYFDPVFKTMQVERHLLGMPPIHNPSRNSTGVSTPVFIGHRDAGGGMGYHDGQRAAVTLRDLGFEVKWKLY
jgi:hypothetical protein